MLFNFRINSRALKELIFQDKYKKIKTWTETQKCNTANTA